MRGRFIVLEGIDGCGKTTQLQHLVEWLPTSGLMPAGAQLVQTREPGGTGLGVLCVSCCCMQMLIQLQRRRRSCCSMPLTVPSTWRP